MSNGLVLDPEALRELDEMLRGELAPIAIPDGFTKALSGEPRLILDKPLPEHLRVYVDAYIDLTRLLEEMRFEAGLAALLLLDYTRKLERGEAPAIDPPSLPMSAEAEALLRRYMREIPPPEELFENPHAAISGHRILGRWFAGQLLDSVLYRTIAGCDRLAILLWTRAEIPLDTRKDGEPIQPAFTRGYLKRLADVYGRQPEWHDVVAFLDYPLFETAKNLRNGFTHSRRIASQLHGEFLVTFGYELGTGAPPTRAIDASDHLALGLASYDAILRPLVRLVGPLLQRGAQSPN